MRPVEKAGLWEIVKQTQNKGVSRAEWPRAARRVSLSAKFSARANVNSLITGQRSHANAYAQAGSACTESRRVD